MLNIIFLASEGCLAPRFSLYSSEKCSSTAVHDQKAYCFALLSLDFTYPAAAITMPPAG